MMPINKASFTGLGVFLAVLGIVVLTACNIAFAADPDLRVDPDAISRLLRAIEGPSAAEPPMVSQRDGGYVHFIGTPPDARFAPLAGLNKSATPKAVAERFVAEYGAAFGANHPEMIFRNRKNIEQRDNTFVRMEQYYGGLPVFGAQLIVHVADDQSVRNVMSDIMRAPTALDLTSDILTQEEAVARAITANAALSDKTDPVLEIIPAEEPPELLIFHPALFSLTGPTRRAWKIHLAAENYAVRGKVLLLDAITGDVLIHYADRSSARYRAVYDANNNPNINLGNPVRTEGQPPTGDPEIDNLYDYFGDCYDFYMDYHGRDSFDDRGSAIIGFAYYPFQNAAYAPGWDIMLFGEGFVADDIVGHEYTHAVTEYVADLIYYGFSGALSEMYSDQGGEFIDLVNGRGNDSPEVRWYLGEDADFRMPGYEHLPGIRYMKDPTVFGDPDRLGSPLLIDPTSWYDRGGVHINSGVGNKLVYLLTDGDDFNGQSVWGMGIPKVADLFYEARPLLSPSADYYDLYFALYASSVMLGFSPGDRYNIISGTRAVEIEPPFAPYFGLRDFRATPAQEVSGKSAIALTWENPNFTEVFQGLFAELEISLYRSVAGYPTGPLDGALLPTSQGARSYLDRDVSAGLTYYYTMAASLGGNPLHSMHARAVAGVSAPVLLTEAFGSGFQFGANPFDLPYSQITFRPVGSPPASLDASMSDTGYESYEATRKRQVFELPVPRQDAQGGAYAVPMEDDWMISIYLGDRLFPYFGVPYNRMYLSANGYLLLASPESMFGADPDMLNYMDVPSLAAHFALPRISFFFTDMLPNLGGEVWARELSDRFVFTFENVPLKPTQTAVNPQRVTVQVEIFYSGEIRFTYLDASMPLGIIGLSDGRGVPREPADEFANVRESLRWVDFSSLSDKNTRLSIEPIATPIVDAGDVITFTARAVVPDGVTGRPAFYAEWDGPGPAPFADMGTGQGRFYWATESADQGIYKLRITAALAGQYAFQDVRIMVGNVGFPPEAHNLTLSSFSDFEDPSASRSVSAGRPLIASYDYYHPNMTLHPDLYQEGASWLYWFRSGQMTPAFTNLMTIPPNVPQPGEEWYFQVTPITRSYVWGDPVKSPVVTIMAVPDIVEVVPNQGLTIGGDRVILRGEFLASPLAIKFGGVPGTAIEAVSDREVSVLTPVHAAGKVTVSIETAGGVGRKVDAFTFVGDAADDVPSDETPEKRKTKSTLGCGRSSGSTSGWADGALLLIATLALVMRSRRRNTESL